MVLFFFYLLPPCEGGRGMFLLQGFEFEGLSYGTSPEPPSQGGGRMHEGVFIQTSSSYIDSLFAKIHL